MSSWQLLFLRSAKNASFDVPGEPIQQALEFVTRCFDQNVGTFRYYPNSNTYGRPMTGAGMLGLSLGGKHEHPLAAKAGDWLLSHPFDVYDVQIVKEKQGNYHYGVFYCAQGMYQLGGRYWRAFFPGLVKLMLANQNSDGSWTGSTDPIGANYITAITILALRTPYEALPIFQR